MTRRLVTTYEIVWLDTPADDNGAHLATMAAIAADPASLTFEQLLSIALQADATAAAWLTEDVQAA
jgi:hypothetical protein